ncbi:MAG: hypothetical protein N2Z72_03270 [Bacteroidales bacterium]|nr:hypothetical protein [Bacteroidales bacterium]
MKKLLFIFLVSIFFFLSCEKKKQEKIQQSWRLIRLSKDSLVTWYEVWEFNNGNIQMIKKDNPQTPIDTTDLGKYHLYVKLDRTYVDIEGLSYFYKYNGQWMVLKMNDEILIMLYEKGENWFYREFVREDK